MADYNDEDARRAARIVDSLLDRQDEPPGLDESLILSDLEADAADFSAELQILARIDAQMPGIRIGDELVPAALPLILGTAWPWSSRDRPLPAQWWSPYFDEPLYYALRSARDERTYGARFETMPLEEARTSFAHRAADFLATRIASVREFRESAGRWFGGTFLMMSPRLGRAPVSTPGCSFSVSSNSRGLRVFWSGAYRISPNYFGHPTTPAVSVLQSGTYVFGVDGGAYGNSVRWDTNAVIVLPGSPQIHLNF
jgi:hypothetical protein